MNTRRLATWEALLLTVLIALILTGWSTSDVFMQGSTITLIITNIMEKALMALPMTLIIIGGEIDLSVASTLGLSSAIVGKTWEHGWPLWACLLTALAVGALCGAVNGTLVTRLGLPSLVVTLGTLALYRGLAYVILVDQAVSNFPSGFADFGFKTIPHTRLPWTILVFVPLLGLLLLLLHRTWIGRQLYAVGSNPEAARFAAVRVEWLKFSLFVLSGLVSAAAGIVYTARVSSSRADNATGFELDVVAAVLLGGVSIFGGRGTLFGVVLSLGVIGTLRQVLALNSSDAELQSIAIGSLLIFSVLGPNVARGLAGTRGGQWVGTRWRSADTAS